MANESEADHRDLFTQRDPGNTYTVDGDTAYGCETGVFEPDVLRDPRYKIAPHKDCLTVSRAFSPVSDTFANLEIHDITVLVDHYASARIAEHRIFSEFGLYLSKGAEGTGYF